MHFLLNIENWIYVKACKKIIKFVVESTWVHPVLWLGAGLLIFLVFCVVLCVWVCFSLFVFFAFFCLRPVCCVSIVVSIFGLFVIDCRFGLSNDS